MMSRATATQASRAGEPVGGGGASARPRADRRGRRGVTLFELVIAIALIALLSGTLLLGVGFRRANERRSAAMVVLVGLRMGMTRANVTGYPVRMVFDLGEHRVGLEETTQRRVLRSEEGEDGEEASTEAVSEVERAAREEAERVLKGPQPPRARFAPVKEFGGDEGEGAGRSLGAHARFRSVQTEHDPEPITEGRAYLYIWPRGGTEEAAIQITDDAGAEGLTVRISALTGRGRIERGRVPLPEGRGEEDDWSEREEE